jgi:hypothetical protein
MAEQVSGQIGQEQVILNNAASENTLRLILEGIKASSKDAASAIDKMAAKAGIDSKTIQSANEEVKKSTTSFKGLKEATDAVVPSFDKMIAVTEQLTRGNAQASEIMQTTFGKSSGVVGLFTTGMIKLAKFQEETLTSYRDLSKVGVNFGGSLTDLRMAASNSYMTLTEFSGMIKKNSVILASMGGSANEGAKAFVKLSNSLIGSAVGSELMSLGYTASDVNQGMLDYIAITGGRTKEELKDTKSISAGTAGYLEQLDRLADVTGKSREALAAEFKQKQETADMELYKASLSVEDRERFTATYNDALAKYGQGAADNILAQAQGRAVTTEAGKKYAALAPMATQALREQYDATQKYGAKSQQARDAEDRARLSNREELKRFAGVLASATDVTKGNEAAFRQSAKDTVSGLTTQKALNDNAKSYDEEKEKREKSQAKAAADTETALKQLGQSILATLLPVVGKIVPVFNAIIQNTLGLKTVIVSLTAAFVAYKAIQLAQTGAEKLKQVRESGLSEAFKKTTLGKLGSKERPMYVIVVGGGAGAGGLEDLLDRKNKTGSNSLEKVKSGGSARGALKGIKGAGIVGALAGVAMLGGDLMSISDRLKNKEITEAEASKERGGAVGETGGGLAGGLAGAAAGAAIGSVIPVIGTAIGGIVGGMIGGFGGGALGKMIGEGIMGPSKEKPKMAAGGIATQATAVTVGEAGPEAIIPLTKFENLQAELATLNTSMHEVIKYMKDTAENTKRTHDATKALNGDWFAR